MIKLTQRKESSVFEVEHFSSVVQHEKGDKHDQQVEQHVCSTYSFEGEMSKNFQSEN